MVEHEREKGDSENPDDISYQTPIKSNKSSAHYGSGKTQNLG